MRIKTKMEDGRWMMAGRIGQQFPSSIFHLPSSLIRVPSSLLLLLLTCLVATADIGNYVIKDFSAVMTNHKPPHETQPETLLEGAEAEPQSGGKILIRHVKLQLFNETGEVQMIVRAPECIFDNGKKTVSSSGPFEAQYRDGQFSFSGVGFLWQQTNNVLIISNRVETLIRGELKKASKK